MILLLSLLIVICFSIIYCCNSLNSFVPSSYPATTMHLVISLTKCKESDDVVDFSCCWLLHVAYGLFISLARCPLAVHGYSCQSTDRHMNVWHRGIAVWCCSLLQWNNNMGRGGTARCDEQIVYTILCPRIPARDTSVSRSTVDCSNLFATRWQTSTMNRWEAVVR